MNKRNKEEVGGRHPLHRVMTELPQHRLSLDQRHVFVPMSQIHRSLIFFAVGLLLAIFLLINLTQGRTELFVLWCAFSFKMFVSLIPLIFWRHEYGWFHPLVFSTLWVFVNTVVRQFPLFAYGIPFHSALPSTNAHDLSMLFAYHEILLALGGLFLLAGYFLGPRFVPPVFLAKEVKYLWLKIFFILLISVVFFLIWSNASGGIEGLFTFRGIKPVDRVRDISGSHWVYFIYALSFALTISVSIRPRLISNPLFWLLILFSILINFGASGSRSNALFPLLMILSGYSLASGSKPYFRILVVGLFIVFMLGFLGQFRSAQWGARGTVNFDPFYEFSIDETLDHGLSTLVSRSTTSHGALPVLAKVPDELSLLYGRSYVSWLFIPIPQALLPFPKPPTSGRLNGTINFGVQAGVSPGVIGEAYWNFHIPGVVAVFFMWGMVNRFMANLFLYNRGNYGTTALYVYFLFVAAPVGSSMYRWIQGSFVIALIILIFYGLPRIAGNKPSGIVSQN